MTTAAPREHSWGRPVWPPRPRDPAIPPHVVLSASTNMTAAARSYTVTDACQDGDTLLAIIAGNNANSAIATTATLADARGNVWTRDEATTNQPHVATFRAQGSTGGPGGGPVVGLQVGDQVTVSNINGAAQWQLGLSVVALPTGDLIGHSWEDVATPAELVAATVAGDPDGGAFVALTVNQNVGGNPLYDQPFDRLFALTVGHVHACGYWLADHPTAEVSCTARHAAASSRICLWGFRPVPPPPPGPGEPLELLTRELHTGEVGERYEQELRAAGGELPYRWAAAPLPAGLALDGATLAGVPVAEGTTDVRLAVLDDAGDSAEATLPLAVIERPLPPEPEPPIARPPLRLIPVRWGALDLNPGDRPDGCTVIVTDVEGWYGTPPLEGRDVERALSDGGLFGPKTTGARTVAITGSAAGPRAPLLALSRQLAAMAVDRVPADLIVGEDDPDVPGGLLTAEARADTDGLAHAWRGRAAFTYQLTLTAADPRLYERDWRGAELSFGAEGGTGREYPLAPPRRYAATSLPNTARLANPGNVTAPVWIVYSGPLDETRLSDGQRSIRLAPLIDGQQVLIDSATLAAIAPGGATRAGYVLAGSAPLLLPPRTGASWSVYGSGAGAVQLRWRGAFV